MESSSLLGIGRSDDLTRPVALGGVERPYGGFMGSQPIVVPPVLMMIGTTGRRATQTEGVPMEVQDRVTLPAPSLAAVWDDSDADLHHQLERTAHGQAVTSRALRRLRERGWLHLDDLHWPGRARAVIDHVAVGPGGIIVVTTVHWIGTVDVRAGQIRHNGRPSAARRCCEDAAAAIRSILPADRHRHVVPALSVVTEQRLDALAGGVVTCSAADLGAVLRRRPTVLAEHEIAGTAAILWGALSVGAGRRAQVAAPRATPVGPVGQLRRLLSRSKA